MTVTIRDLIGCPDNGSYNYSPGSGYYDFDVTGINISRLFIICLPHMCKHVI